jgi:hypothetical protein
MNLLERLFAIQLHENQTIGGYIVLNYLTSKDKLLVYAVNKKYQKKIGRKMPHLLQIAGTTKKERLSNQFKTCRM